MLVLAFEPSWTWTAILFVLGLAFVVGEILLPSGGLLTVLSVGSFIGSIVVAFLLGHTEGLIMLFATALAAPILIYAAIRVWPHTPVGRRIILEAPTDTGTAGDLAGLDPDQIKGRIGVAKTSLRPAGKMVLDGCQIDCVTEGMLVARGQKVMVLEVHGAKVIVRPLEDDERQET